MIGQMDRKATFYNPTNVKSASGGTTVAWAQWANVWCKLDQPNGFKTDAGSQDNLVFNATARIRYSSQVEGFLSKDTRFLIDEQVYQVVDYQRYKRDPFVTIRAVSKANGAAELVTSEVKAIYHTITPEETGDGTATEFVLSELVNKEIITIETLRAVPMGIIYTGTPGPLEMKFTTSTGKWTVNADAPLLKDESFRVIYK